jgi:serine/threonine protein kinase/outer membrane protein assembly factor BamB
MESLTAADPRTVGEFRLRARLGAGGMGQVFLATSLGGRAVAVKVIHGELASDEEFVRRFRAEVDAAQRVSGVYTAPVVAAGVDDRPPWLATAFVPGPPLDKVVARHGPLPGPALWRLAAGLAEALRAIHSAGLIHRDLKPANVLLAADGPRVIDFGISRAASDSNTRLTATGSIIGTPSFMSPEQVEARDAGPASDVFSLGSVLVYAATGSSPFSGGPNVSSASVLYRVVHAQPDLSRVPGDIRGLVEACLAKDPGSRPGLGQVAAICASAAEHLRLSAAAFWPPDVARVIAEQAAGLTAQIDALQEDSGYPSGPASLQDASAWGSSTTAPRLDRPMTTHPPAQPSYWGPDSHPSFPPGAPMPSGPMPSGPMPSGPGTMPQYPRARPEYLGTSRRGLITGAVAVGVAVVGGGAAWLVSSQSKNGTPAGVAGTSPPATGGTGAFSVGGKGTRRTATWEFTTGNAVNAVPTVAGGVVYVASTDGKVYAVNASSGKQVWASPAGSGSAPPEVVGNVLCTATQSGDFTALDTADGTVAWTVKGKAPAATQQRPWAADGSTVILFSYTDGMQAYDAATGNPKSRPGPPDLFVSHITAAGGVLYALDVEGGLHAIRLAGNATLWQLAVTTTEDQAYSLAISDGHVYVGTQKGTLHSVNATTGHRDWSLPGSGDLLTPPVVSEGMIFIVDLNGNLRAINADTGKQAWQAPVTAGAFGPAAANGQVYLSAALTMQAWDATSGKPSWYFQPPNYKIVQATPAVADGTVYVGSSDYNLYAIKALSGAATWAPGSPVRPVGIG